MLLNPMTSEQLALAIRRDAIEMVHHAHASHIGGALSVADVVAVLYSDVAHVDPQDPQNPNRDRIIMSKGHNGTAIYAALAERGFFPKELLQTYGDNGSIFSCHVSSKKVPGVEVSTGSLGHGIGIACGMALNSKLRNRDDNVYCIVGDGECNEGSVWEAAMLANQYQLDCLTVIVDRNHLQGMGYCRDVIDTEPLADKWKAFGWTVVNVEDGNDHQQLRTAFATDHQGKPKVIIANTIKGKGVSYMENELLWHYRDPQGEFYDRAMEELGVTR